jgi:hypothetical protein
LPASTAPVPSPEPARQGEDAGLGAGSAERRQLTVMFCDLVGSARATSQTGHCLTNYFECRPRLESGLEPALRADFMGFDPSRRLTPVVAMHLH